YTFPSVSILEGDLFIVALSPLVDNMQVHVKGEEGSGYSMLVITNGSLGAPVFTGRLSLVELIPESSVTNLTLTFNSNSTVKMLYSVLTNNYTYYRQVSSEYYTFSNGILVVLRPQISMPKGASKITFILNRVSMQSPNDSFPIQLPPLATVLPFAVAIILLIYLNAYVIVDSYYISMREELSRIRKLSVALLLALSVFVIYWLASMFVKY
ncbi:MAG: hypothetical protein QW506_07500, partial [Thermoproteota archaeon]